MRTQALLGAQVQKDVVDDYARIYDQPGSIDDEEDEPFLNVDVLNPNIMDVGTSGPSEALGIKVVRFMFGAALGQSLIIIGLGFLIFKLSARLPIYDKRAALIIMWVIVTINLLILTWVRKSTKASIVFLVFLTSGMSLIVGFTSILLGDIAPIQFMTIIYGQTVAISGYTFVSPHYIDLRMFAALSCFATVLVWCVGIFTFYNDHDWPTAIFILILGFGVTIYYVAQIKYSTRYHLGEKLEAFTGMFVDPILVTMDLIKRCFKCSCLRAPPPEPSPFEENAVIV